MTRFLARSLGSIIAAGLLQLGSPVVLAHGNDQMVLEALSEAIAGAPDVDLLIRRGELYRHLGEWEKAAADFDAAARLAPTLPTLDFFRARLHFEAGAPAVARPYADRFVLAVPGEAEGWFLRAEIAQALGERDAAVNDYLHGIEATARPRPEHYLRTARFLATPPDARPDRAREVLAAGLERLGPVVSLLDHAIKLAVAAGQYDEALQHLARAMEHSPRGETWLVRKGDILVAAGRGPEAVAAYRAALEAIAKLPDRYRESPLMEWLATSARTSLDRIAAP